MSQYVTRWGMSNLASHINSAPDKTKGDWARDFGISRPYLYQLIDGKREPSVEVALRIAAATGGAVPISTWPNIAKILEAARGDGVSLCVSSLDAAE
ncbi:MAG TPA: hypothetical protein DEB47_17530 [Citreicella sp.]|nr:hypothetical protein [Citreicella sp.]